MDILETSVDIRALDDAGDFDDIDVTEQLPALDPEELDVTALTLITGGMRWDPFRPSKNVEDRRGPEAIARDQQWWDRSMNVPLPPRRPEGIQS